MACLLLIVLAAMPSFARPDLRSVVFDPYPLDTPHATHLKDGDAEKFLGFDKLTPYASIIENTNGNMDYVQAIARTQEQISKTIDSEGPYSETLEQQLQQLAGLYQDSGQYQLALATNQRAIQISKINYGLYHEKQIPLIESSIKNLIALGQYKQVNDQFEFLIYLHQKCYGPDSTEMIGPLASKVAWDMHLYENSSRHAPNMLLNHKKVPNGMLFVNSLNSESTNIFRPTQQLIIRAIRILIKAGDFTNPFLHQFEQQLIETYFYQVSHDGRNRSSQTSISSLEGSFIAQDPYDYTKANFNNGTDAYERLLSYLEKSQQKNSLEYVLATIGLGDWYLLFGEMNKSEQQYGHALKLLNDGDFSEQDKQYLLKPAVPTELPAFGAASIMTTPGPEEAFPSTHYRGYVDVRFEINRYGHVMNLDSIATSEEVPAYIVSELGWRLRDSRFRPPLAAYDKRTGEVQRLRYYYGTSE
ncbi:MAG: hypothetical protein RQ899_09410 [Pseudomonadales bacterium]|nr:hypothetical protein [Pseudomonadales bacterium]